MPSSTPLNDLWEASASQPFHPSIGKNTQFTVGFTLLLVSFVLASLFGLSMSRLPWEDSDHSLILQQISPCKICQSMAFRLLSHSGTFTATKRAPVGHGTMLTRCRCQLWCGIHDLRRGRLRIDLDSLPNCYTRPTCPRIHLYYLPSPPPLASYCFF